MPNESPPVPDPTVLTTEQLLREVAQAKELMEARISGVEEMCEQRFVQVKEQFRLVENQRVEQKKDTQDAVDAAFSASKEAVKEQTNASEKAIAKSEGSTKEQLNQMGATFTTAIQGLTDLINDLKERFGKFESRKEGATESKTEARSQVSTATTIIGSVVAALVLLLAGIAAVRVTQPAPTPQIVTVTTPAEGAP